MSAYLKGELEVQLLCECMYVLCKKDGLSVDMLVSTWKGSLLHVVAVWTKQSK